MKNSKNKYVIFSMFCVVLLILNISAMGYSIHLSSSNNENEKNQADNDTISR